VRAEKAGIPAHVVDYGSLLKGGFGAGSWEPSSAELKELDSAQKILRITDEHARLHRLKRLVMAEHQLITLLDPHEPDLVCLAGFMRLVSPYFLRHYNGDGGWRVLNIHPALLPAFPGEHGYEDTLGYGCRWGGVTVHFVDEGEDTGPIIAQAVYPIWPDDTLERVRRRGLSLEYSVYAQCIQWIADGQVQVTGTPSRRTTTIKDPRYPEVLRGWTHRALASEPPL
jgi:phosphoribosylglycinamide formyltransferase-1